MIKCEVFLARSASYDEVRSPHKTWLFAAFHHFHFSSLGATGFVLSQEGDIRPPFFVYGKAGASPPHPCKVLGFHPKPHKFFEKNLTKNFYLSPPNLSAGRLFAALSQLRRL